MYNPKKFYMETACGDVLLVEIYENFGNIVLIIGDERYDLTADAAFELADAILTTK